MIGRAPRALAASLYQVLITDQAWSLARDKMGYTTPVAQPLMVMLAGQPFIDVQLSFTSFIPKTIHPKIASKLVNHWLDCLRSSPKLHDKVEFDIAITTFSFDIDEKIEKLTSNVLNDSEKKEVKKAYLEQTIKLVTGEGSGSLQSALNDIEILKTKQKIINTERLPNLSTLFPMVSDCINYGTIPFAILARHGFIAQTILRSLLHVGIISENDVEYFLASIKTVASKFVDDMDSFQFGELSRDEFMARYGHLRPGTYDILSKRYDKMDDMQLAEKNQGEKYELQKSQLGQLSENQKEQIEKLLFDNGFGDFSANDLMGYIREAIVAREYSKFVFTKSVSDILEVIACYSLENGLSRDEISHVSLRSLFELVTSSGELSLEEDLRSISAANQEQHKISTAIRLPQLLFDEAGIYIVPFQVSQPNFITQKSITGSCVMLESDFDANIALKDMIILIEGADPGFDWIFSQNIKALITKYGGANSHMAIRCAEFGIPAAIGCGEQRFEQIMKSNKVSLDCSSGLLTAIE
jgi:glutamine kinase